MTSPETPAKPRTAPKAPARATSAAKAAPKAAPAARTVAGVTTSDLADATPALPDTDVSDGAASGGATLKLRTLVDAVVKATGGKKKGVKEIVEATLSALGDALTKGDDLNLPPLGKAKVNRQRDIASGEILIVRLRRGPVGKGQGRAQGSKADQTGGTETLAPTED